MDRLGFIHDKLDIKILILFVLRRLPDFVDGETLAELAICDDGINYFDYSECLAELVDTGHVEQQGARYRITEKGDRNGAAIESSLPYSVRKKAERLLAGVAAGMRRSAMIKAAHTVAKDGACTVELALSDGVGEIMSLRMLTAGESQAEQMEKNFRENAERLYGSIIELMSGGE